jgi:hypothetical protein
VRSSMRRKERIDCGAMPSDEAAVA